MSFLSHRSHHQTVLSTRRRKSPLAQNFPLQLLHGSRANKRNVLQVSYSPPRIFFFFILLRAVTFPVRCLIKSPGRACRRLKFKPRGLTESLLFFTPCQVQPRAGAGGCERGVQVWSATLVKYLHGHEFSIWQRLLPWGAYHRSAVRVAQNSLLVWE